MIRVLAFLICCVALIARADIVVLPGSADQQAPAGTPFPNPIAVRVVDSAAAPVPHALVTFGYTRYGLSPAEFTVPCLYDAGLYYCHVRADAQGIAVAPGAIAAWPGDWAIAASVSGEVPVLGGALLWLHAAPNGRSASLQVVSGGKQRATIGWPYSEPFVVRLLSREGAPMAGVPVSFDSGYGTFLGGPPARVLTDANGYASSPPFTAGWGVGPGYVEASAFDDGAMASLRVRFETFTVNDSGGDDLALQNLWWGGPSQNGWGFSVVKHGPRLFNVLFAYDASGNPTWRVQPDGYWSYGGLGNLFFGPMYSPRGSAWHAYDASRFSMGSRNETDAFLRFYGASVAELQQRTASSNIVKRMVPNDFSATAPSPLQGLGDMWWGGPGQDGWGVVIHEQPGGLFLVWFTYDDDGKPTWFYMPGGNWTDERTYAGTLYRATGSEWTDHYEPARLDVRAVGPYTIRFESLERATLDVEVSGRKARLSLQRYAF